VFRSSPAVSADRSRLRRRENYLSSCTSCCGLPCFIELVVSGDRHLLELREYQGIPILPAAEALQRVDSATH
jgi:hypothetical protein